jgi:DNA invertase Pin-like site-specific DNA recombinase
MKHAVYTRVSTISRRRLGDELVFDQRPEVQAEPLCKLAERRGWSVTHVYTDRTSGTATARPALTELMADARRGRFDVLMIWRFDRLSRRVLQFLQERNYCWRSKTSTDGSAVDPAVLDVRVSVLPWTDTVEVTTTLLFR